MSKRTRKRARISGLDDGAIVAINADSLRHKVAHVKRAVDAFRAAVAAEAQTSTREMIQVGRCLKSIGTCPRMPRLKFTRFCSVPAQLSPRGSI